MLSKATKIVLGAMAVLVVGGLAALAVFKKDTAEHKPSVAGAIEENDKAEQVMEKLKIEVLKEGSGEATKNDDLATVHYTGMLEDGTKFDSSLDRNAPFSFYLGAGQVIKGWDLGVLGMKVGEKRKLTIPPELGYGAAGIGSIPGNATLIFEVEMLQIN